jgi:glycosyltransferase involved in cell wall biosynthesis
VYDLVTEQLKSDEVLPEVLVLKDKGEFANQFKQTGVPITSINPYATYSLTYKQIKKVVMNFRKCDIIHFHGFHIYFAILAIFSRKKILYTEHGNFSFGRKKKIGDKVNHFLRKQFFQNNVDKIACNSKFTQSYLQDNWQVNINNLTVVYNGCNLNKKANNREVEKIRIEYDNTFIIGTTSRLVGFKKVPRLVAVFKKFLEQNNNSDAVLVIVGEGPERGEIEKEAGDLINKRIYLTGFKPNPVDYQKAFDVCIYPSQYEPFGLVAVESYSSSKPVIVFQDGGGLTEIVGMCDPDDIVETEDEMVERLHYYYKNSSSRIKNTSNIIHYFTAERMANDYLNEYRKLICAE